MANTYLSHLSKKKKKVVELETSETFKFEPLILKQYVMNLGIHLSDRQSLHENKHNFKFPEGMYFKTHIMEEYQDSIGKPYLSITLKEISSSGQLSFPRKAKG